MRKCLRCGEPIPKNSLYFMFEVNPTSLEDNYKKMNFVLCEECGRNIIIECDACDLMESTEEIK